MNLTLYHGTDLTCANSIINEGFVWTQSDEHWLGNGVYFYLDFDLAKWRTTKPSKKFGTEIKTPRILSVQALIDDDKVLDLRKLSDFRECLDEYREFEKYIHNELNPDDLNKISKLRCAFFDWLFETNEIDCVIGSFSHNFREYLVNEPRRTLKLFKEFNLFYVETQICVINQNVLSD